MRIARVNITLPDDLVAASRAAGLNVSQLARHALIEELDRRAKIAQLDVYLADLDRELGPITEAERAEAERWANRVLDRPPETKRSP